MLPDTGLALPRVGIRFSKALGPERRPECEEMCAGMIGCGDFGHPAVTFEERPALVMSSVIDSTSCGEGHEVDGFADVLSPHIPEFSE